MRKGFTLAELLGVIVVIGLLLLLIIPAIINGVSSREDEVEAAQNEIIFEATAEYLDRDKEKYPNISGNIYCVSIGELLDAGLLVDPVKKLVEDGNYSEDVMVEIKITNDGARSYALIEDGTGEKCTARSSEDIMITINPDNSQWAQQKTATITYPNLGGANQYTRNEGTWQSVSRSEIELTYTEDGTVSGQVIDSSGNVLADETEKVEKIDREDPIIIKISKGSWNDNAKQQVDITMTDAKSGVSAYYIGTSKAAPTANSDKWKTFELSPYGGTGTVSQYLSEGTYYIFAKDRAGNISDYTAENSITIKDDVPPTCTITLSGTEGNNGWYRSNVGLKMTTADEGSGVASYGLTTSKTTTYNSKLTATQTADTKSTTYYGYVKDKAGNINKCSAVVKKDTTKPSCSVSTSGTKGSNSWYISNVTISLGKSDSTSGTANYGLTTSSTATYNSTSKLTRSSDTKGLTYYGYVKDTAGNTSKCSTTIKRDATKPSCSLKISGTIGNNSWYTSNVTISFNSKSDSTSGISTYGIVQSSSTSYNKKTSVTHNNDGASIKYYGFVKDAAGNTNSCNKTFKRDATKPTCYDDNCDNGNCGIVAGGGSFSSRWCGSSFWVRVTDNLSGVASAKSRHCYHKIYGSTSIAAEWGPACGGSNDTDMRNWLKNNRSFKGVPYLSGGYAAHGLNAQNARIVYQFQVTDKAGNTRDCGSHIKSFAFNSGDCPGGTGF